MEGSRRPYNCRERSNSGASHGRRQPQPSSSDGRRVHRRVGQPCQSVGTFPVVAEGVVGSAGLPWAWKAASSPSVARTAAEVCRLELGSLVVIVFAFVATTFPNRRRLKRYAY
jgi:hypothetical protein